MTMTLGQPPIEAVPVARPTRWRSRAVVGVVLGALAVLVAWRVVGAHPAGGGGGFTAPRDARPIGDGVRTTRYVLPSTPGDYSVMTSIRNTGRVAFTPARDDRRLARVPPPARRLHVGLHGKVRRARLPLARRDRGIGHRVDVGNRARDLVVALRDVDGNADAITAGAHAS